MPGCCRSAAHAVACSLWLIRELGCGWNAQGSSLYPHSLPMGHLTFTAQQPVSKREYSKRTSAYQIFVCIILADVLVFKPSHMVQPRDSMGRDYTGT